MCRTIYILENNLSLAEGIGFAALTLVASTFFLYKKSARKTLTTSKILLQIFETLPYAIVVLDAQKKIVFSNTAFLKLLGWELSDIQENYLLTIPDQLIPEYNERFDKALRKVAIAPLETKRRGKNGSEFDASVWTFPIFGRHNEVKYVLEIIEDLKARKEKYSQQPLSLKIAEHTNEERALFLASVSHEIRTPLASITGFAEVIRSFAQKPPELEKYIDIIYRNAKLLAAIIDDILDVSKIDAERMRFEKKQIILLELFESVVESFTMKAQEKNIRIQLHCPATLPLAIWSDEIRIKQVLYNVVGNAIKFTNEGSVEIEVVLEPLMNEREKGSAKLYVKIADTGIGIAKNQEQLLFKSFSQVGDSPNQIHDGSGLGLFLAKRMCQAMGGDLRLLESSLGKGSTFLIEIVVLLRAPFV